MDNEMIKALKENRLPVCYMSEDLRTTMLSMDKRLFRLLIDTSSCHVPGWRYLPKTASRAWGNVSGNYIYTLIPDYAEKPKVVECQVEERDGELKYEYNTDSQIYMLLMQAVNDLDFIGFKYDDDRIENENHRLCPSPRLYMDKASGLTFLNIDFKYLADYEVLTPTAVLFKA